MPGSWGHILEKNLGRLHIEFRHSKSQEGLEVIRLQLTARGPINEEQSLDRGFTLGHEAIVRTFTAMTSEVAHTYWKRTA